MATTIAELVAVIGADVTGLRRGLSETESSLQGLGGRLNSLGSRMTELGMRIIGVSGPLRTGFNDGMEAAMAFEDVMAEFGARTGATEATMSRVSALSLELGANTAFSATDAARGMLELAASGASVEEAMAIIPSVLNAAAAGGMDLKTSADAVTDIMAAFKMNLADAGDVANVLAQGAGASSAEMTDLVAGFQNVGGVANNFGLSVEDTAAALAIFNDAGTKGAEAGTQLRTMLTNMTSDAAPVQAAWEKLGTSMYDVEGNVRDLDVVIGEMSEAMGGMTDQEKNDLIRDLGGAYGQTGLSALLAQGGISGMRDKMQESADVSDVAQARMDTLSGKIESLQGSIDALSIKTLSPFMKNVLAPFLEDHLIPIVNAMGDWANKNPEVSTALIVVAGAVLILGPLLFGLGQIVAVGGTLITGMGALTSGFWGLVAPILAPLVPLALLAGGILIIKGLLDTKWVQDGLAAWPGVFENGLKIVTEVVRRAADAIKTIIEGVLNLIGAVLDKIFLSQAEAAKLYGVALTYGDNDIIMTGGGDTDTEYTPGLAIPAGRSLAFRAQGGKAFAGEMYGWQERGVEAFIPAVDGTVMPAHRLQGMMGGGGAIQVTGPIYVQGVQDVPDLLRQLEAEARRKAKRLLQ